MVGKKRWFLAGMISILGICGCDENDDNDYTDRCDVATFVPFCADENMQILQSSDRQVRCSENGTTYIQMCSNGCITDSSGKSTCVDTGYNSCDNCINGDCINGQCVPKTCNPACTDGMVCQNGQCVESGSQNDCIKNEDCASNEVCSGGQCLPMTTPDCSTNEDCFGGKICSSGKCIQEIKTCSPACGDGQICDTTTGTCKDRPSEYSIETCGTLSVSGSNACEITGTGSKLAVRGDILANGKIYQGGTVLMSGNIIQKVGCLSDSELADAKIITCPDAVVSPGLSNADDHITYDNQGPISLDKSFKYTADERFDHRHDWRKNKNGHTNLNAKSNGKNNVSDEPGELRQLLSGTTAVFGSGDVNGLIRNVDKAKILSASFPNYQTFPLGDSGGNMYDSGCSNYKYNTGSTAYAFGPHIGEGINQAALNELRCLSGEGSGAKDIFTDKLAIIHGVAATPEIIQLMADRKSKLIWSPRSNISLYGDTALIPLFKKLGVTIALGTDWTPSGSANMLREMQCADFLNTYYYDKVLSDYDIWMAATYNSAFALSIHTVAGDLAPNKIADVAVYHKSGRSAHRAVIDAENKDVAAVILDGKLVYGDDNLINDSSAESLNVCGSPKKILTKATGTSKSYSTINAEAKYPLFFCATPEAEPTCIPMRPRPADTTAQSTTLYGAESFANNSLYSDPNDIDGDGIPNDKDNCPTVFNPIRPQDKSLMQANADGDQYGDVCDPYPFCATNDASCGSLDPTDKDGDGIKNDVDNCSDVANTDQTDSDNDGIGDACDACPNEAAPGTVDGCPLSTTPIQEIRNSYIAGTLKEGTKVMVEGIVTGYGVNYSTAAKTGFFIQQPDAPAGIYVFDATSAGTVSVGDKVTVSGDIAIYYNFVEIKTPKVSKTGTGSVVPIEISATESAAHPNRYDSVLVTVKGLTTGASSDKGVWTCTDASGVNAYIDDFQLGTSALDGMVTPSTTYDVTGIIVYDFSKSKIAPRNAADLVKR